MAELDQEKEFDMSNTTTTPTTYGVPMPAGAVTVEDWYHPDKPIDTKSNGEPGSLRYFTGSEWTVNRDDPKNAIHDPQDAIHVQIDGEQYADGHVERFITVDGAPLTLSQARELADAVRAAADEAALMAHHDQAVTR